LLVLESTVCRTLRTHVVPAFRSVTPAYAAFGWLVAGSLLPVALLVVIGPRTIGVARPAWRLLVDRPRDDPLGLLVTVAVLLVFAAVGWRFRDRLLDRRRQRRGL
jgi:NSS family neurotransmitter:Na+ symporter